LTLRDDVVFAQVLFRRFAKSFFGFDLAGAELSSELQVPVLGDLLGFREAVFLGARAAVLPAEIAGTLPAAAVRAFVNVDLAAQDRVVFRHRRMPPELLLNPKNVKELCSTTSSSLLCQNSFIFLVYFSIR
jgi:hypothetical protein